MAVDGSGYYWLATENGVVRFDGANFTEISPISGKPYPGEIIYLHVYKDLLYIVYGSGIIQRLDLKRNVLSDVSSPLAMNILQTSDTTIFIQQSDGWLVKYVHDKEAAKIKIENSAPTIILQYWHERILVSAYGNKTYQVDPEKMRILGIVDMDMRSSQIKFAVYGKELYFFNSTIAYKIDSTLSTHIIWDERGKKPLSVSFLARFSPQLYYYIQANKRLFEVKKGVTRQITLEGLGNVELRKIILQDSTHLLISTNQGLFQVRNQGSALSHLEEPERVREGDIRIRRRVIPWKEDKLILLGFPFSYLNEHLDSFSKVVSNQISSYDGTLVGDDLYITTEGDGLAKINMLKRHYEKIDNRPLDRTSGYYGIYHLKESDTLFVAGKDSIIRYVIHEKSAKTLWVKPLSGYIRIITRDSLTGNFWAGTETGLYFFDPDFKEIQHWDRLPNELNGRIIGDLLFEKRTGKLWIAHDQGVDIMNIHSHFEVEHLPSSLFTNSRVVTLKQDRNNRVWMATYGGIVGYDPATRAFVRLGKENGLVNSEFNYKSAAEIQDGRIIFGGLNGYDIIEPNAFDFSKIKEEGRITGYAKITSTDTTFHPFTSDLENKITFDINNEILRIYLSAKNTANAALYNYEYSLDGENWIKMKGESFINIFNLAPRNYTLIIRAFNEYGSPIQFSPLLINASETFFKSTTFIWAILSTAGLFLALYITLLLTRRKREKELKEKISMDLHDEVGTILTRSLYLNKSETTTQNRKRLDQSLNEALYSLRAYIHTMNRQEFPVTQLRDELIDLAQSTLSSAGYHVESNTDIDNVYKVDTELYRDIKLCLYEILNNTIRHANGDRFKLDLQAKDGSLYIYTQDNGILKNISQLANKGNGISNLNKRIRRHQGNITFDVPAQGTGLVVKMNLPIGKT
jgi:signal transduction histidine kinase